MTMQTRRSHTVAEPLTIVFLGLSITSAWGNGHATTYRALLRELSARGHRVVFLERDASWYRNNADLAKPSFCETIIYDSITDLYARHTELVAHADAVILGSYVPEGHELAQWLSKTCRGVTAFY